MMSSEKESVEAPSLLRCAQFWAFGDTIKGDLYFAMFSCQVFEKDFFTKVFYGMKFAPFHLAGASAKVAEQLQLL